MSQFNKISMLLLCTVLSFNKSFALEQIDESAIQGLIKEYTVSWNQKSGEGFGNVFTQDADFVNIFGNHYYGREEIEQRHIKILNSFLKASTFTVTNVELREVQPGLVIGHVNWKVEKPTNQKSKHKGLGKSMEGIFSHVFVKQADQWEITATQNTLKTNRK